MEESHSNILNDENDSDNGVTYNIEKKRKMEKMGLSEWDLHRPKRTLREEHSVDKNTG